MKVLNYSQFSDIFDSFKNSPSGGDWWDRKVANLPVAKRFDLLVAERQGDKIMRIFLLIKRLLFNI